MLIWLALTLSAGATNLDDVIPLYEHTEDGAGTVAKHDYAQNVILDADGNAYVVGYVEDVTDHLRNGHVVKLDIDGTVKWRRTVDSGVVGDTTEYSDDRLHAIALDGDTLYVGGMISSWWAMTTAHQYWYIGAYGVSGDAGWTFTWQQSTASAWQGCYDLALDSSGRLWGTGVSFGSWSGIQQQWATMAHSPIDGSLTAGPWYVNQSASHDHGDIPYGIAIDPADDSVIVVGQLGVSGAGDTRDLQWHVVKYAADGTVLWTDTFGGPSYDNAFDAVVDDDGSVYVVGRINKTASIAADQADWDITVVKYTGAGDAGAGVQTWRVDIDDGGNSHGRDLALLPDGSLLVVGGRNVDNFQRRYAAVLDPATGAVISDHTWPGNPNMHDGIYAVDARDGLIIVAGYRSATEDDRQFWVELVEIDSDGDGTGDRSDGCPLDPDKTEPGVCGCGEADADEDADGVLDCEDLCPGTPAGAEVDEDGCELEDTDPPDTDPPDTDPPDDPEPSEGCGCATQPEGVAGALAALGFLSLLGLSRRRR